MKLSKTFCTGKHCGTRQSCARFTGNLARYFDEKGLDWPNRTIAFSDYSSADGSCRGGKYEPLEDLPPAPPARKTKGNRSERDK